MRLSGLAALVASCARAQSLDAARRLEAQVQVEQQAQAQARTKTRTQTFLNYGSGYEAGSAQMFH